MIIHTSTKSKFATRIKRTVLFYARPKATKQKQYREPVLIDKKYFPTTILAKEAAMEWESL